MTQPRATDAVTVELSHEAVLDLMTLANGRSWPGSAVSVDDLIAEAVDAFLAGQRDKLAEFFHEAEDAERERVASVHGGGDAA